MVFSIRQLRDKLCRELAQSEHSAATHCEREARRYGRFPPGQVLRAIGKHAATMRPELQALAGLDQPLAARVGRGLGEALSSVRHIVADRIQDAGHSYRDTLLGVRHGLDVARTLRAVLVEQQESRSVRACDALIDERSRLISEAEGQLCWFARNPDLALRAATTIRLQPRLQ